MSLEGWQNMIEEDGEADDGLAHTNMYRDHLAISDHIILPLDDLTQKMKVSMQSKLTF